MEHVHSIILIKRGDKYLNYFDERWGMYLFPNIKGNDIEEIKNKYNERNRDMMKQIPYGLTDFARIQKDNYYYVDKTMFIERIEMQPAYLFLIRPRRFGKSLTLAMLEAYYDVVYATLMSYSGIFI